MPSSSPVSPADLYFQKMKTVSALVLAMCALAHAGEDAIDSILSETQRLLEESEDEGPKVPCWKSHVCSHGELFFISPIGLSVIMNS